MTKEYKSPDLDIETFDISAAITTTSGFSFEEDDNTY